MMGGSVGSAPTWPRDDRVDHYLANVRQLGHSPMGGHFRRGLRPGLPIDQTPEDRVSITRKLGDVVPSMLPDARTRRPRELDALTGAVRASGRLVGVPTPYADALHRLTRLWMSNRS